MIEIKKSVVFEIENDDFRAEYHGRYDSLLIVCKKANDDKKVLKFEMADVAYLLRLSELLDNLAMAIKESKK